MSDWAKLIQEAIDDSIRKNNTGITCSNWDDPYGGGGYGRTWSNEGYYSTPKAKRKHKFSPVLLVFSTVYNCEHCGAKQEDCKSEYCDSNDELNIGDWG